MNRYGDLSNGWQTLENLQKSFDFMPVMIASIDRHERYLVANREYAARVDKPLEEIIGRSVREVVGVDSYQLIQAKIQECLEGRTIEYEIELWGAEAGRVITVRYYPRFTDVGEVTSFMMLGLDITHNRRVVPNLTTRRQDRQPNLTEVNELQHRDLDTIQNDLLQAERMAALGRASALVSHELRNPLGAMAASLNLLSLRNKDDSEMQKIVARLWHNLGRCDRVVSSMLDFSKPITLDRQSIQPDLLVEQVLQDLVLPSYIDLDWLPGECAPVKLDVDLMTRALANLLDNAMDSMAPPLHNGAPMRLLIRCGYDDCSLTLEISDTGHGMDRETVARLFEPFFSTKVYGMGIGALFARNVITAHHGQMSIESRPGCGTKIRMMIPFDVAE